MAALRGDLGPGIVEATRSTYDLEHHVRQVAAYVASSDTAPSRWSLQKGSRWEVPVRQTVPRVGANRFGNGACCSLAVPQDQATFRRTPVVAH